MNCANHSNLAAVAFCRTCGKPLCQNCTRDVRGVIYCESCLAARMEAPPPVAGFTPVQGYAPVQTPYTPVGAPPPNVSSGPNPAVAGILAGFFPIGVGAVYCSQYAKGLAHLVIMVLLIIGVSSDVPWYMHMILGIGIGFFYFYQIIDAVRTAKAIQMGEPAPDPFGLAQTFGTGEKFEGAKVPTGAAVLIGLGVLFFLHTAGLFEVGMGVLISLALIALGVWIFAKNWGLIGSGGMRCRCEACRTRRLMGPAMLVTIGVLLLLDTTSRIDFGRTWPAILLVIGVVKLVQSNASRERHVGNMPPMPPSAPPPPFSQSGPPQSGPADPGLSQSGSSQSGSSQFGQPQPPTSGEVNNG